jgi:hypothetical protein
MICGHRIVKTKLAERPTLVTPQTGPSWIDLAEHRVTTAESRFSARLN